MKVENSGVLCYFCFTLQRIYLPVMKRVICYFELTKINRLWLTQIFLCRFYISFPELIRLANDIETNSGPVAFDFDASKTICAPSADQEIFSSM